MKKKDNTGGSVYLRSAMSRIDDRWIDEAASAPAAPRKGKILRAVAIAAAAAIILTSVPLGIFLSKRAGSEPEPELPEYDVSRGLSVLPEALRGATVTADGANGRIIPADSTFTVKTSGDTSPEELAANLSMTPSTDFSVTALSSREFRISPASGKLNEGAIYRLSFGDPENPAISYAFQTDSQLLIRSFFPAAYSDGVPVDTAIVVSFSEALDESSCKQISLYPNVKGKAELISGGTAVVFLPDKKLEYDTQYEIRVGAGVKSISGKELGKDESAVFRTAGNDPVTDPLSGSTLLEANVTGGTWKYFTPGNNAVIGISLPQTKDSVPARAEAEIYRFTSTEAAYRAVLDLESNCGESGMPDSFGEGCTVPAGRAEAEEEPVENSWQPSINLDFGASLEKGIYYGTARVEKYYSGTKYECVLYFFFQITGIRAVSYSYGSDATVWVQDPETGKTLSGISVEGTTYDRKGSGWNTDPEGEDSVAVKGKTDEKGMFRFTPEKTHCILKVFSDEGDLLFFGGLSGSTNPYDFCGYVYTDRQTYHPGDRVNIWGYVSGRNGAVSPGTVYLSVGGESGKRELTLSEDGTFTAYADIPEKRTGWIAIALSDAEGRIIVARSIKVTNDPYPDYVMELNFDKLFFTKGENITGSVSISFFDGTPAAGIVTELSYEFGDRHAKGTLTLVTDGGGVSRFEIPAPDPGIFNTTGSVGVQVTAAISGVDISKDNVSGSHTVYISDYILNTLSRNAGMNSYELSLFTVDFEGILANGGTDWTLKDPVAGEYPYPLRYSIEKIWYEETTRTEYDSFTGKTVTYTDKIKKTAPGAEGEVKFVDGKATFTAPALDADDPTTSLKISWSFYDDSNGCTVTWTQSRTYQRTAPAEPTARTVYKYPEFTSTYGKYVPGETVTTELLFGGERASALIFICTDTKLIPLGMTDGNVSFTFTEEMIGGVKVGALYYDKETGTYKTAVADGFRYDFERRSSVSLEIGTDRDSYNPGDSAVISVHAENGAGARVLLSVVDEACFALGDQREDMIYALYRLNSGDLLHPKVTSICFFPGTRSPLDKRYDPVAASQAVDGGSGEGYAVSRTSTDPSGTYVREYFADNPVFIEIKLDENGNGALSMRVTDNITRWRITALAVAGAAEGVKELRVGSGVSSVICTQEMFASLGIFPEYLERDDVTVSARAFGAAATGPVSWRGEIKNAAGVTLSEASASSEGNGTAWLHFGKLAAGEYSVTVYADCGEARDALKKTVRVVEYAATVKAITVTDVAGLANIRPASFPVTISFFNRNPSDIYDEIIDLLCSTGGERLDAVAARYVSVKAEIQAYGTDQNLTVPSDIGSFCKRDSDWNLFPSLFRYSEGSVSLLAELLASCPEILSDYDFSSGLYKKLLSREQTDRTEFAAVLASLAAYGEPVLGIIDEAAKDLKEYTTEGKLFLALAYAVCGDNNSANGILAKVVVYPKSADGTSLNIVYVEGADDEDTARLTGLALLSAARTSRGTAEKMVKYLLRNRTLSKFALSGLSAYIRYYLPSDLPEAATVVYSIGGPEKKITLKAGQSQSMTLSKTEFESLSVKSYVGEIGVRVFYPQSLEEAERAAGDRKLTVKKSINWQTGQSHNMTITVTVSGWTDGEDGFYQINDFIPTGALFVCFPEQDKRNYSLSYSGRRITGGFFKSSTVNDDGDPVPTRFSVSFSYVIRGVLEGEYVSEPCVVFRSTDGATGFSGRSVFTFDSDGKLKKLLPYKG